MFGLIYISNPRVQKVYEDECPTIDNYILSKKRKISLINANILISFWFNYTFSPLNIMIV